MKGLFVLAFKNQWAAQMKKPLEFFTALVALILNNSFYLYGIYLLAVLSIGDDTYAIKEYLVSTGMVLTGWGLLNVCGGGLCQLSRLIETGELEAYLAKPRAPLLLVALSQSNLISFGEIVQGLVTIVLVGFLYGFSAGFGTLISAVIVAIAFAAIVIFIGTFSFFSSKGSQLSYVILQVILSLSLFPVARALQGRERWILYCTPLLITATLPRSSVLVGDSNLFLISIGAAIALFFVSLGFFAFGLQRYKARNYFFLNE